MHILKALVSVSQHIMITYRKMSPLLPRQAAVHKTTVIWQWTKVHIVHFTLIEEVTWFRTLIYGHTYLWMIPRLIHTAMTDPAIKTSPGDSYLHDDPTEHSWWIDILHENLRRVKSPLSWKLYTQPYTQF